ncbi:MAG: hypothetical protein ACLP50_11815 [Solirubrobacteraceae bacterium]
MRVTAAWKGVLSASFVLAAVLIAAVHRPVLGLVSAAVGVAFAAANAVLVWLAELAHRYEKIAALLDGGGPCRARDLTASRLGIEPEALPEGVEWQYVPRHAIEAEARQAARAALAGSGASRLVMLRGEPRVGKTRILFETLQFEELRDGWVMIPRIGASLEELLRQGKLPRRWSPCIVVIDDIERYVTAEGGGLTAGVIWGLPRDRPTVLIATAGGRAAVQIRADIGFVRALEDLQLAATVVDVPLTPSTEEQAEIRRLYPAELAGELIHDGVARRMVASRQLAAKLTLKGEFADQDGCREGQAVARAAADWRRAGAQSGISREDLQVLYRLYLPDYLDADEQLFNRGLTWARAWLPYTEIALLPRDRANDELFDPHPLAVAIAEGTWPAINDDGWNETIERASVSDCLAIGLAAYDREGIGSVRAERAWRRGEAGEDPRLAAAAATNLGLLLHERGDSDAAEPYFRRGDEYGLPEGSYNLGVILQRREDLAGAEAAFRRADERGDPIGTYALGVILRQREDLPGAEAAFLRADERGDGGAANDLGALLARRGDPVAAEAAFRRADERGDPAGARNLGQLLAKRRDSVGAEAAFGRADERGDPAGANKLGVRLAERGDLVGAEAAFRRADERGDPAGAFNVGLLLDGREDWAGAEAAFRRADERGDADGAFRVGELLAASGDLVGAEAAFRRADERGHPGAANNLGILLHNGGDVTGAEAAWRRADERGDPKGTANLAILLRTEHGGRTPREYRGFSASESP